MHVCLLSALNFVVDMSRRTSRRMSVALAPISRAMPSPIETRAPRPKRRKISLACEPCRERKSRCDGQKPICGLCSRRGLGLEDCVYSHESARMASTDEYVQSLHARIRHLESLVRDQSETPEPPRPTTNDRLPAQQLQASAPVPSWSNSSSPYGPDERIAPESGNHDPGDESIGRGVTSQAPPSRASIGISNLTSVPGEPEGPIASRRGLRSNSSVAGLDRHEHEKGYAAYRNPECTEIDDPETGVSAMGTALSEVDLDNGPELHDQFYGGSSAASFIRESVTNLETAGGQPRRPSAQRSNAQAIKSNVLETNNTAMPGQLRTWTAADLSLPPRGFADRLIDVFYQNVFCLYPVFHWPTFKGAYTRLWTPSIQGPNSHDQMEIRHLGLGSSSDAPENTPVFHCALNAIFALSSNLIDLRSAERSRASRNFFFRSKSFLDLDFLESNNIGVIQSLLIVALYLQSTPYPRRCWTSVGVACRLAQSFGLYNEGVSTSRDPLEMEIRRRVWHGCVILDMTVSMTFGRPTMTTHISNVRSPSLVEEGRGALNNSNSTEKHTVPYLVESIRLSSILEEMLNVMYRPWFNTSDQQNRRGTSDFSLDTISDLDNKLNMFEESLPAPFVSQGSHSAATSASVDNITKIQANTLRSRLLYLRLLLYRPVLSKVVAKEREAKSNSISSIAGDNRPRSSFTKECAITCANCAVDLITHTESIFSTKVSSSWWWDTLYASTSGLVLILALTSPTLRTLVDTASVEKAWARCQMTLQRLSDVSIPARRSLELLRNLYQRLRENQEINRETSSDAIEGCTVHEPPFIDPLLEQAMFFGSLDHSSSLADVDLMLASLNGLHEGNPEYSWDGVTFGPGLGIE